MKLNFKQEKHILILQALFQFAQHLYEKREESRSAHLTNGSVWPKSLRILIRNTAIYYGIF